MDHEAYPLVASNTTLLNSGQYSDLTVRCGGNEYRLHRAIVCPRSDFLTIACDGRFKVRITNPPVLYKLTAIKEGATGVIDLPEDDPPTFARLVSYLYTLDYNDNLEEGKESDLRAKASANALVYAMADKYNIPSLSTLAVAKFRPIISKLSDEDLPAVIEVVVTTTLPSRKCLRSPLFTECVNRMQTLVKNEAFIHLLDEHAEVGSVLAREGYEKMRAEVDQVEHRLSEASKAMTSQHDELRTARKTIADLEGELKEGKRWISDRDGVVRPARSGGYRTSSQHWCEQNC